MGLNVGGTPTKPLEIYGFLPHYLYMKLSCFKVFKILTISAALLFFAPAAKAITVPGISDLPVPLVATANSSCIRFKGKFIGMYPNPLCGAKSFFKSPVFPHYLIGHREPTAIVEVTGKVGRTKIVGMNAALNPLMNAISKVALSMQTDVTPTTGSDGLTARSSQHYMDANVYGHSFTSLMETSLGLQQPALAMAKYCQIAACMAFPALPDCHGIGSSILSVKNDLKETLNRVAMRKEEYPQGAPIAQAGGNLSSSALSAQPASTTTVITPREAISRLPKDRPLGVNGEFIRDGNSQIILAQSENFLRNMISMLSSIIAITKSETETVTSSPKEKAEICSVFSSVRSASVEVENIRKKIEDPSFTMQLYPKGNYLPYGYPDENDEETPGSACPLTSAGYFPVYKNPTIERKMSHCSIQDCKNDGLDGDKVEIEQGRDSSGVPQCWRPSVDYYTPNGISCNRNNLSSLKVEGLYPACNGRFSKWRKEVIAGSRDSEPEVKYYPPTSYNYKKSLDHRAILESKRLDLVRDLIKKIDVELKKSQDKIKSATGVSMQECRQISHDSITPTNTVPKPNKFSIKPWYQQDIDKENALSIAGFGKNNISELSVLGAVEHYKFEPEVRTAQAGQIASAVGGGQLASMGQMVNSIATAIQMPGQFLMGQFSKAVPFGLRPVFISAAPGTFWQVPKLDASTVTNLPAKAFESATGLSGALCKASSLLGIGNGCIRKTGYSTNPVKIESALEVARAAYSVAEDLKSIDKNKVGPLMFNMDYPYTKSSINPLHAGSACWPVGTPGPLWSTSVNPLAGGQLKEGYGVFTFWKNTGCVVAYNPKPCFVKKLF